ncbi:MAG: efflux RND transporter periplasmic adaptor subunit [Alphaproteobacteria bacterium]|nr:efflux RND transporter periplasmic adaptor subunit [Alphaproteobacteria bacterium]MCL2452355.1 efflux RND transporter periplasmic adaptor subunit [Alphaproteobacteria bacterium]
MPFDRKTIRRRRNLLLSLVFVILAAAALAAATSWWFSGRFFVETDNAFVTGNLIPVYADATGFVARVYFEETEVVKKDDLLIRLDAQRATALLGVASADLAQAVRHVSGLFADRRQTCQRILSQRAQLDKIRHDIIRYKQAVPTGAVSKQVLQNAEDQAASLEAELSAAHANFQSAQAEVGGTTPKRHPEIELARSKFIDAAIELERQEIRAPVEGYIAKRKAQVGDRVHPGDQLMTIVPLDHLWVEANLWETSLHLVRPGQPVRVTADLYGRKVDFHGTVEGLVPGTGSVFALLPPDNATGNFIHIVQRVPVRIALDRDEILKEPLRPGLSTVISIDVRQDRGSPNEALTNVTSHEYETTIFSRDVANANAMAEKVIKENQTFSEKDLDTSCPVNP